MWLTKFDRNKCSVEKYEISKNKCLVERIFFKKNNSTDRQHLLLAQNTTMTVDDGK